MVFVVQVLFVMTVQGQSSTLEKIWQSGSPFITNYSSGDYHAALQNWGIVQGGDGSMYFANNSGVLRFDGVRWTMLKPANNLTVRSIAKDSQGNVFVGGTNDLGVLQTDPTKGQVFRSLLNQVSPEFRNFGRVWSTHAIGDTLYFVCSHHIFKLADRYFKGFKFAANEGVAFSWVVEGKFYAEVKGKGLLTITGETLVPVGGKQLQSIGLTTILPYADGRWLMSGSNKNVYLFDRVELTPFLRNGTPVALNAKPYYGIRLKNGDYVFATLTSGIYIIDSLGNVKMTISKRDGLPSDAIYCAYEDRDGDLWLGTENGISHVALSSPLRLFGGVHGVEENPSDVEFFENSVYVVNSKGLFKSVLHENTVSGNSTRFVKVPGVDNQTTDCFKISDRLIVANMSGVFSLDKDNTLQKISSERYVKIEQSFKSDQIDFFYGTLENSIGKISFEKNEMKNKEIVRINKTPEELVRTAEGNLLINTRTALYELSFCDSAGRKVLCNQPVPLSIEKLRKGQEKLLPYCLGNNGDNEILMASGQTFYRFDATTKTFKIDTGITQYLEKFKDRVVHEINPGKGDSFWLKVFSQQDGRIQLVKFSNGIMTELPALNRLADAFLLAMDDTGEGYVLIGSNKGVVVYREEDNASDNKEVQRLTETTVSTTKDSVRLIGSNRYHPENLVLPYITRDLHFEFSIPAFNMTQQNKFQYKLEGYDDNWSEWSTTARVDYTNLREGDYFFYVRGRDVYDREFVTSSIQFRILPPWYRTWWSFVAYAALFVLIVFAFVQWRSAALRKEQKRLENIITERTAHIRLQAEKLREMDIIKTRFFANISHEFRTPLTLIMGPLEMEIKKNSDTSGKNLQLIKRNADRLLELVNQLLEVIKTESGAMTLELQEDRLSFFLDTVSASFESLARQKQITFLREIKLDETQYLFDRDKLDKICVNLLSNAFKFTSEGQRITFIAEYFLIGKYMWLRIVVSDTGRGIADDEKEKIFQSFYQASNATGEAGTGLGLSLVQELVKLYGGKISLESELTKGSTFTVELPIDPALL